MRDKITLVIPTYNRYDLLYRLLKYYESFNFPTNIIILDSSKNKNKSENLLNLLNLKYIKYIEYPDTTKVICKILKGIEIIQTPYTVICADDDFLTPSGIFSCYSFLDSNKDYSCAQGKSILFSKMELSNNIVWQLAYLKAKSVEDDSPTLRLYNHFTNYNVPTFYALTRTCSLLEIFKNTEANTDDLRFGELLPSFLTVIKGKMKVLDVPYSFRDYCITSDSHTIKDFPDFILEGIYKKKYLRFKDSITTALISNDALSKKKAQKIIDKGMRKYLGASPIMIRSKFIIIKILERLNIYKDCVNIYHKINYSKNSISKIESLHLIEWDNPEHPNYQDIKRIKEAILNY